MGWWGRGSRRGGRQMCWDCNRRGVERVALAVLCVRCSWQRMPCVRVQATAWFAACTRLWALQPNPGAADASAPPSPTPYPKGEQRPLCLTFQLCTSAAPLLSAE